MMNNNKLTNEELVVLYREATGYKKEDLLIELMDRMSGIMQQVVNRFSNIPNCDEWDRLSILHMEFVKCLDRFDLDKGYKLTTVARTFFMRSMEKYYAEQTRQKRNGGEISSYDEIVESYENGEGGNISSFSVDCIGYDDAEFLNMLDNIGLSERERLTCEFILTNGLKRVEIAKELGVSEVSVHNYIKNIGKKLMANNICLSI